MGALFPRQTAPNFEEIGAFGVGDDELAAVRIQNDLIDWFANALGNSCYAANRQLISNLI